MTRRLPLFFVLLLLCSVLLVATTGSVYAAPTVSNAISGKCITPGSTNTLQGTLDGANYTIQVPTNWNGTLVLYSHGYTFSFLPLDKPAPDASDIVTATALLQSGYALAGSSYSQNGWALQQAFHDQIALLDYFNTTCGKPVRTIAWGDSLGGIITAGLVQLHPNLFAGALPMCGVLAGGVGTWNQALDSAYAFDVLLAGNKLPVVNISDPSGALRQAEAILSEAQKTPPHRNRPAPITSRKSKTSTSGRARSTSSSPSSHVPNSKHARAATHHGITA